MGAKLSALFVNNDNKTILSIRKTRYGKSHIGFFYVYFLAKMLTMCDLTNQQAYDIESCAKDYWLQFLKDRANRDVEGAQGFVDKIEFCEQ